MEEKMDPRVGVARLLESSVTPLAGAWSSYYQYKDRAEPGTPKAYGIVAIKRELVYRGYGKGIDTESLFFGAAARDRTKEFQRDYKIGLKQNGEPTGVVASGTARKLFKKRVWDSAHKAVPQVPGLILCRQLNLESGFDPAAVGNVDPRDRGLAQINSYWHPSVSDAEAFDPAFCIPWAANYLAANLESLGDLEAATAAHNVGRFYARKWLEAGKPTSGLFTEGGMDVAVIITRYLKLVNLREC